VIEMNPAGNTDQRRDLLAEKALWGLSAEEEQELRELQRQLGTAGESEFELLAATIDLGFARNDSAPLPEQLSEAIERTSSSHLQAPQTAFSTRSEKASATEARSPDRRAVPWLRSFRGAVPWLAAAACLMLAVIAWLPWESNLGENAQSTLAKQRETLLREDENALVVEWSAAGDPTAQNATGDVVWSNKLQKGFLRLKGLAANDPQRTQYQAWIFDAERDSRYPIDGGVFNVETDSGEVIVPLNAKLKVNQPAMFAVTVEEPGGVVVSDRGRLALIAKTAAS